MVGMTLLQSSDLLTLSWHLGVLCVLFFAGFAAVPAVHHALPSLQRAAAVSRHHADALLDRRVKQR